MAAGDKAEAAVTALLEYWIDGVNEARTKAKPMSLDAAVKLLGQHIIDMVEDTVHEPKCIAVIKSKFPNWPKQ